MLNVCWALLSKDVPIDKLDELRLSLAEEPEIVDEKDQFQDRLTAFTRGGMGMAQAIGG